jgi:general secretion pathway protein N
MPRSGALLAAGIAAFLLFLLAFLPATLALRFVPPELALEGLSGSVWNGSVANASWRGKPLGPLRWSSRFWRLPLLELNYAIAYGPPGEEVSLDVVARPGGKLELSAVRGTLPVSRFQGFLARRGWNGRIELDIARVELRDARPVAAEGTVLVRGLSAPYAGSGGLGDFELTLGEGSVGGQGIAGRLRDLGSGPLTVRATLQLDETGGYLMSGEVATAAGADPRIQQALAYLGPPDSLGRRQFAIEGTL